MTTRILVASDLSEPSDEALRQAYARARDTDSAMAVCLVLPDPPGNLPLLPFTDPLMLSRLREHEAKASGTIQERLARVIPGATPEIFVERGREYAEIARRAEAWQADLVVVGSRGETGLTRLLLGSVAEGVVRYAHCDVLVARPVAAHGVVMAATDLSDAAMPAVTAGVRESRRASARLEVVHAVNFTTPSVLAAAASPFGSVPIVPSAETSREVRAAIETGLREVLKNVGSAAEASLLEGPPAAAIARHAAKIGAELVVVGTHGRTGLARIAIGSVAERVVRLAPCSVLVVRMARGSG